MTTRYAGRMAEMLAPGVSHALARWRSSHYANVRYRIDARLARDLRLMHAAVTIHLNLDAPCDIVLDWLGIGAARADAVRVNGKTSPDARAVREHIMIGARTTVAGENTIAFRVTTPIGAPGSALLHFRDHADGGDYVYTLSVPADARTLFPCFDQPDLKARFTFSLECPSHWRVVSNARQTSARPIGMRIQHVQFGTSAPISTYLFAFAAGPFAIVRERDQPRSCTLWLRRSRLTSGRRAARVALELNRRAIAYFAAYTDRPLPFEKYDLVLLPEFAFNGMEHAGATFLREEAVLLAPHAPAAEHGKRANLILHEAAHQWFGNLVTMRWFDDVWIKEAFANWLAARAAAVLLPSTNPWLAFAALKSSALQTDASAGTTALRQRLANLADAKSLYGNIVYGKGPALLRQLEHDLGERAFRRGVRDLIATHAYDSIDRRDLVHAFASASGRDLTSSARSWIDSPGLDRIAVRVGRAGGRDSGAIVIQRVESKRPAPVRPQRFAVAGIDAQGSSRTFDVRLDRKRLRLPRAVDVSDRALLPNDGDVGYGLFSTTPADRDALLKLLPRIKDPLRRWSIWSMAWESVRNAELPPASFVRQALRWLPNEQEPLLLGALLERMQIGLRRYSTDAQRETIVAEVEVVLSAMFAGTSRNRDANVRTSVRRAFIHVACTDRARERLYRWLTGRNTRSSSAPIDLHRCARRLLVLDASLTREILRALRRHTPTADRGRLMFATAAAARHAKVRQLDAFLHDASLPESWIEEAIEPFNAIEHAAQTQPLLAQALRALPRLKRERKIFFVNRWIAAFIGGQHSVEALRTIQRVLPSLPPDLRRKVLEQTDELERTVRIRARFDHVVPED